MSDKQYDNTNRATLWLEENKQNPKAPDFTGTINVNGTDYRLSMWKKKTAGGKKLLSGSVQPMEAQTVTKSAAKPAAGSEEDDW